MTTKKYFLPLFFLLVLLLCANAGYAQKRDDYNAMASEVLMYVNKHRAEKGLKPLVMKDAVSKIAAEHSRNMASGKVAFGHDGMDDRVTRANNALGQKASAWAENVATGQRTAQSAVTSWLGSKGHKENIEGNYEQTGIGIARAPDGVLYYTQIFIRPRKK